MGNVEEQTRGLQEEIRKVGQGIKKLREQIGTCSASEEELRRVVEELLREIEKEKELQGKLHRREKEHLQEQNQRDREGCTDYDWLNQKLPSWDFGRLSKAPSTTQKERVYTPLTMAYWDVDEDIENYHRNADNSKRKYQTLDSGIGLTSVGKSKDVLSFFLWYTCNYLSEKRPGSSVKHNSEVCLELPPGRLAEGGNSTNADGSKAEDNDYRKVVFYAKPPCADVSVQSNGRNVAVFEHKNGGLGCPVDIYRLEKACSCWKGPDRHCWCNFDLSEGHARSILKCMLQLYDYLVMAKVQYGVLTDVQNWYLFKRDHDGSLKISRGFKWDGRNPPLAAVIVYLLDFAVDTGGDFDFPPRTGMRFWAWETSPFPSPGSSPNDDEDKDITFKKGKNKTGFNRQSPPRTRSRSGMRQNECSRQNELPDLKPSDLHLDDHAISTGGWSGCVIGGNLKGCPVAVKLAERDSEQAEAILNEVSAYQKLQKYWGEFVPSLVGYGTTAHGQVVFIATELIDGNPLGLGIVTEEVATVARQALAAVHECKLLHGDVEARNIMVVRGTQPSVRLIDFGFAERSTNWKLQHAELKKLDSVFNDVMGVGGNSY